MNNPLIDFLALALLVIYPAIPVVVLTAHLGIKLWRRLGNKAYLILIALWLALDLTALLTVWHFREAILAWRLFENPFLAAIGFLLLSGGLILGIKTVRTLTVKTLLGWPEIFPEKQPATLVTAGPYRLIRHPRYLEYILESLGLALLSGLTANFLLTAYLVVAVYVAARAEETELMKRFGPAYAAYRGKSGMFLPKIKRG